MMHLSRSGPRHVLVLGLGNILLQDEGLGIRAVEHLAESYRMPSNVEVLDGGTLGLSLLPYIEQANRLLVIDAMQGGRPPGSLVRQEGAAVSTLLAHKMSLHQAGLEELLAASRLQGSLPDCVVLWGMEPFVLEWGVGLSPQVANALDALVESVAGELSAWGVALETQ